MVGIKVSSYSEYKVKNGLLSTEQFRHLGQNGTCYYIVFDEWKDIRMCTVYVVVLNQNTQVVTNTLFWGPDWRGRGTISFQFSSKGKQMFFNICFQFQEPSPQRMQNTGSGTNPSQRTLLNRFANESSKGTIK